MKNADAKLFRTLQQFKSATRILITGTPLQNNLKELWSLLHFLMPKTFMDWEAFEVWFDFSDLEDEEGTQQFIGDRENQELVKKIHKVLQPLLLRRIKADVATYLPKKREYVLYAPMTKEQTDLYNVISDKGTDTRAYLENKVVERLTSTNATNSPRSSARTSRQSSRAVSASTSEAASPVSNNAFSIMMGKRGPGRPPKNGTATTAAPKTPAKTGTKRKNPPVSEPPEAKSRKSSGQSTPSTTSHGRGRPRKGRPNYQVTDDSEDDKLNDDEFEAKLVKELEAAQLENDELSQGGDEAVRTATLELASRTTSGPKIAHHTDSLQKCRSRRRSWEIRSCSYGLSATALTTSTTPGPSMRRCQLMRALLQHPARCFYSTGYSQSSSRVVTRSSYSPSSRRSWISYMIIVRA